MPLRLLSPFRLWARTWVLMEAMEGHMLLGWICYACKKQTPRKTERARCPEKCDCGEYLHLKVERFDETDNEEVSVPHFDYNDYSEPYALDGYPFGLD